MSQQTSLLSEIEAFVASHNLTETMFGRLAVNDGKFVGRIRAGGDVSVRVADRVRDFIREKSGTEFRGRRAAADRVAA